MPTWHPQGIHHGPHPKAIPLSRIKDCTDEMAVVVDTHRPLQATPAAGLVENLSYWASWKEPGLAPAALANPDPGEASMGGTAPQRRGGLLRKIFLRKSEKLMYRMREGP
jgi:hypothetical protein